MEHASFGEAHDDVLIGTRVEKASVAVRIADRRPLDLGNNALGVRNLRDALRELVARRLEGGLHIQVEEFAPLDPLVGHRSSVCLNSCPNLPHLHIGRLGDVLRGVEVLEEVRANVVVRGVGIAQYRPPLCPFLLVGPLRLPPLNVSLVRVDPLLQVPLPFFPLFGKFKVMLDRSLFNS